jgi:hypothetical protein
MRQELLACMWKMHAFYKSYAWNLLGGRLKMVYTQLIENM